MFITVLAARTEVHNPATLRAQAADKLFAKFQAGGVLVYGDVDGFLILEVSGDETVQPRQIAIGTTGHGDGVFLADGDEGSGVQFALGDDAFGRVQDAVYIIRNKFGVLHHLEVLLAAAELGVYQHAVLEVVEADAVLFFAGLGHEFFLFGDLQVSDGGFGEAADEYEIVPGLLAQGQMGGVEDRAMEVGRQLMHPLAVFVFLTALTQFGFVGSVAFPATVVAEEFSVVKVDGQRFVAFVAAGFAALRTGGFDAAGGAAAGVDAEGMKVSHNFEF